MSKKNTILKLIENGEEIIKEEFHPASDGFFTIHFYFIGKRLNQ